MKFSILIPTYNRKDKLKLVLREVAKQGRIVEGEVIVGIDGSEDGTEEMLNQLRKTFPGSLVFFKIPNSGRAVIRNRLIEKAQGEILIFIQDDIVVTEGWLSAHLEFHQQSKGALVGHMTWYPEQEITPYMKWLESGGHMMNFSGYRDGDQMDFWHFYMGNLSVLRDDLVDLRFDEEMKVYGWEDIMLGYEYCKNGSQVFYSSGALAYHWDEYREENLKTYMTQVGQSAVVAEKTFPGAGFVPPWWKKMVFWGMIGGGALVRQFLPQSWRWYLDMKQWFLQSVADSRSSL